MKKYDSYKDSGIDWIGQIPIHWQIMKLRNILSPVSKKNYPNMPLLSITREQGVIIRDVENKESNHNYIPEDLSNYKLVCKGQFAMNKMKSWQGSYGVSDFDGIVSPAYYVFNLDFDYKKFFHFAIRSNIYVNFFAQASTGIRIDQWDLSLQKIKDIPFAVPPIEEQKMIAEYLDDKTEKIKLFIEARAREIELLKELRRSIISKAVTQGLYPFELKDSGVDWLGQIPTHWQKLKLSQVAVEQSISNKNINNENLLSLSYGKIKRKDINTRGGLLPNSFEKYQVVYAGNIILRLTDLQNDHKSLRVGLVNETGIITSAYVCLNPNVIIMPQFLYYLLYTYDIKKIFYSMGNGIRQSSNYKEIRKLPIIVPKLFEQKEIADYLDRKCSEVDSLIDTLEKEISYFNELRKTIISNAVTGKIKIRK